MSEAKSNIWNKKIAYIFTLKSLIGTVLGAIGGYIYYIQIGCDSGSCAITSNPYMSVLWGVLMGYLIGDMFNKKEKKES
jgi:hypothetical protein